MIALETLKKLFNTDKTGNTYCFSLICWTNGRWSIVVTDDWYKWTDNATPRLDYTYSTPSKAVNAFLAHIKKHNINLKSLQEKD